MDAKYDPVALRSDANLQAEVGRSVAIPPATLLAVLDDLERYRLMLKRIVGWDYPCADKHCGAGEVAAQAFNTKGMV